MNTVRLMAAGLLLIACAINPANAGDILLLGVPAALVAVWYVELTGRRVARQIDADMAHTAAVRRRRRELEAEVKRMEDDRARRT